MPDGFADKLERAIPFNQDAPARGELRLPKQAVRQNQKKQIRRPITNETFEFPPALQAIL